VAAAAGLFGTTGTAAALGPDDLPAVTAGAWRSLIGGLALVAVAVHRGEAPWRYSNRIGWTLVGGGAVAAYHLAFFEAVDRTGVAVGTLVSVGTGPIVAGLIDWVVEGHRPSRNWIAGAATALAGVVLLSGAGDDVDALGLATLALAYVLWGVGLRDLRLSLVVVVTLLEPAVASVLAVVVLDEAATLSLLVGVLLVGSGVVLASRPASTPVD